MQLEVSPIPVTNWTETVIDGKRYLVIDVAKLRIPMEWDPSSNVFLAIAAPTGGLLNYPALVQGDDGATPAIDNDIDFTALAAGDATADFASWTETSPNVYKLALGLHVGQKGDDGDSILNPADYGTPLAGKMLIVSADTTAFVYQSQKIGNCYYPTTINSIASGNPASTLCPIPVPAQDWDWRPTVTGQCLVTGTGADVAVDLLARLDTETSGNIVARAIGGVGVSPPTHVLSAGKPLPPVGTDAYDKVLAGQDAIIWIRAERRSGTDTFTTSASNSFFRVKVEPIQ